MKKMMILLVSISVVACASQKTVEGNERLIGGSEGYLKYVDLQAPEDACNKQAFKEGFISSYLLTWNDWVGAKERYFSNASFSEPVESAARQNHLMYQKKIFNLAGLDLDSRPYSTDNAYRDEVARCAVTSYGRGRNAGTVAATDDFKDLEKREAR